VKSDGGEGQFFGWYWMCGVTGKSRNAVLTCVPFVKKNKLHEIRKQKEVLKVSTSFRMRAFTLFLVCDATRRRVVAVTGQDAVDLFGPGGSASVYQKRILEN
jgi:hypothetical protein